MRNAFHDQKHYIRNSRVCQYPNLKNLCGFSEVSRPNNYIVLDLCQGMSFVEDGEDTKQKRPGRDTNNLVTDGEPFTLAGKKRGVWSGESFLSLQVVIN
jgi:hypothetical protein